MYSWRKKNFWGYGFFRHWSGQISEQQTMVESDRIPLSLFWATCLLEGRAVCAKLHLAVA